MSVVKLDDQDMVVFRAIVVELKRLNGLLDELVQNINQYVTAQTVEER